jgi:hypothetical protein
LLQLMERDELLGLCEDRRSGHLLLVGPPGIGKTALVQAQMAHQASQGDVPVLTARSNLTRSALVPVTEWLAEQLPAAGDKAQALPAFMPFLDDAHIEALAEIVDPGRLSLLHPERSFRVRREARLAAAAAVLANHLSWPSALLVFDDFHWSDADSREVIERLLATGSATGGRIILLSRPSPEVLAFAADKQLTVYSLPPLSPQACRLLVRDEVIGDLSEAAVARIIDTSGGNPLFVKVLTRARAMHSPTPSTAETPPTIEATIQFILGELGPLKGLVMAASVIGRRFHIDHLRHLSEPQTNLEAALERLVQLDVLVTEQGGHGFQHVLLRDCAYNMLPQRRRRMLHGRLARALMQHDPGYCAAYPELIADHFLSAQAAEEAVAPSLAAGMKFLGSAQFDTAAGYLDHALSALRQQVESDRTAGDLLIRAQTLLGATQVQRFGFSHPEVVRTYEDLDLLVTRHNAGRLERLHALYGLFAHRIIGGKVRSARKVLLRMERIADRAAPDQRLLCLVNRSAQRLYAGDFPAVLAANRQIFETYDPAQHGRIFLDVGADPLVSALTAECHVLAVKGQIAGAKTARDAALAHIERIGAKMQLPWVQVFAAQSFHFAGDRAERERSISQGLELADAQGSNFWSLVGRMWQGVFAVAEGDFDSGEAALSSLIPAAADIGMLIGWPVFTAALAGARAAQGDSQSAVELAQSALRRINEEGEYIWAGAVRSLHRDILHPTRARTSCAR